MYYANTAGDRQTDRPAPPSSGVPDGVLRPAPAAAGASPDKPGEGDGQLLLLEGGTAARDSGGRAAGVVVGAAPPIASSPSLSLLLTPAPAAAPAATDDDAPVTPTSSSIESDEDTDSEPGPLPSAADGPDSDTASPASWPRKDRDRVGCDDEAGAAAELDLSPLPPKSSSGRPPSSCVYHD